MVIFMYKIDLGQTHNTRSLSYLTNKENKRIKDNLIIRSDNLSLLDDDDINTLKNEYKLKHIIDLRTIREASKDPDRSIYDVNYILNSILEDDKIGITKNDKEETNDSFIMKLQEEGLEKSLLFMDNIYKNLIHSKHAVAAYKKFVEYLVNLDGTILYHCSAGKDRAGFATFIILASLDFDLDVIFNDYLYTNDCYKNKINAECIRFGEDYRGILECVYGVKREYLATAIAEIEESYKSIDNFLFECLGVTKEIKNKLKEKYLV